MSLCSHFAQRVKQLRGPLGRRVLSGPENVTGMELRRQTDLALPGSLLMVPQTVSLPLIPLSPQKADKGTLILLLRGRFFTLIQAPGQPKAWTAKQRLFHSLSTL